MIINLDEIDTDKFFRQLMSGIRTYKVTDTYVIDEFKKYYFSYVKEAEELAEYEIYNEIEVESSDAIEEEIAENGESTSNSTTEKTSTHLKFQSSNFQKYQKSIRNI